MRGQLQHVFTFIMLIVLAGFVLLLGYRLIFGVTADQCEIGRLELKQGIEESVKSYSRYGTVQTKEFRTPCREAQLCFVDANAFGIVVQDLYEGTDVTLPGYPLIEAEIRSPSTPPNSLFLIDKDGATVPLQLFSEKIDIADGSLLCVNSTSGKFRVVFEGAGLTVGVRRQ